jgi:hypothetical protein
MKFWDKLKAKLGPEADQAARLKLAKDGERLESFVETGAFDVLIELVLDPMEKEAFEAFKKIDPSETLEVLQTQKLAQVVAEIKRRVESKIQAGLFARQQLLDDSTPKEG